MGCLGVNKSEQNDDPITGYITHLVYSDSYWMILEEMSVFWEVIISVTVRQEVHVNMCLILNCYNDGAVCIWCTLFFPPLVLLAHSA